VTTRRQTVLIALAMLGVCTLVYWPSLGGEFVYDDHRFVAWNPAVQSLGNVVAFFTDPSTVDPDGNWEGIYRPLRSLSFAVDHAFFGTDPVGYRLHSLLLHVAASLALGRLIGKLLRRPRAGLALGFLYAVHPVHVESVAWITSRADVMSGLGVFLALLAMRRFGSGWTLLGTALIGMAVLAKEGAVVAPVIGLLLDLVLPAGGAPGVRRRILRWLPSLVLVGAYLVLRQAVLQEAAGQRPSWGEGLGPVAAMTVGLGWYVWRLTVPLGFRFDYQLPHDRSILDLPVILIGTALLAGLVVVTVPMLRRRRSAVGAGVWWFLLALGPVSNVIVPINILVAERFLYLPAAGWMLALGGLAVAATRRHPEWRWGFAGLAMTWFVFLGLTTVAFARNWSREETLWKGVISHSPDHFRGYHGLAKVRVAAGDYAEARRLLKAAIVKEGTGRYAEPYYDLGRTYLLEGRDREAVSYLRHAVDIWRRNGATAKNRAYIETLDSLLDYYRRTEQNDEARRMQRWLSESRRAP